MATDVIKKFLFTGIIALISCVSSPATATDKGKIYWAIGEFGWSISNLLLESVDRGDTEARLSADIYARLADQIETRNRQAKAVAQVVESGANLTSVSVVAGGFSTRSPAAIALSASVAWAADKTGQILSAEILQETRSRTLKIVSQAIRETVPGDAELARMTPNYSELIENLRLGGRTLREVIGDDDEVASMFEASVQDLLDDMSLRGIRDAYSDNVDINTAQSSLINLRTGLTSYENALGVHYADVSRGLKNIEESSKALEREIDEVGTIAKSNSEMISVLTQISFSDWTTRQKLQAVQSGVFPALSDTEKVKLEKKLEAEIRQEKLVNSLNYSAKTLEDIGTIAENLGLSDQLSSDIGKAQTLASSAAAFAGGNYLSAFAGASSLLGAGRSDVAGDRHRKMMMYLQQEFAQVNERLKEIKELQKSTLEALLRLETAQQEFRREVLQRFDDVESRILNNTVILRAILSNDWTECDALYFDLVSYDKTNHHTGIYSIKDLKSILADRSSSRLVGACYLQLTDFVSSTILAANWAGQIVSLENFPFDKLNLSLKNMDLIDELENDTVAKYKLTRDFVRNSVGSDSVGLALAQFSTPYYRTADLDDAVVRLVKANNENPLSCDYGEQSWLRHSLRRIACVQSAGNKPKKERWDELVTSTLLSPFTYELINVGLMLSDLVDFTVENDGGVFSGVPLDEFDHFADVGLGATMAHAVGQRKAEKILGQTRVIADVVSFQQGLTYGAYTASKLVSVLDSDSAGEITLNKKSKDFLVSSASEVFIKNSVQAHNVVLLTMRQRIAKSLGGKEQAEKLGFRKTYYQLALNDLAKFACNGSWAHSTNKLTSMFPGWQFAWVLESDDVNGSDPTKVCIDPDSHPELKVDMGPHAVFAGTYVKLPTSLALSAGLFQMPQSLLRSIKFNQLVATAQFDRTLGDTIDVVGGAQKEQLAFEYWAGIQELLEVGK